MRNWLRKWLGVDQLEKWADRENRGAVLARTAALESIDGRPIPGSVEVSPLHATICGLVSESQAHTEFCKALDKRIGLLGEAIEKRLLRMEKMLGFLPESESRGCRTVPMQIETVRNFYTQSETRAAQLEGKYNVMDGCLGRLVGSYAEIRKEVSEYRKAVDALRDGPGNGFAETLAKNLSAPSSLAITYEELKDRIGPKTPAERDTALALLGIKSATGKSTKKKSPAKPKKAR